MNSIFNGQYFSAHSDKILGILHTHNPNTNRLLTDRFGKPQPQVWGNMEDVLKGIDVPVVQRFEHFYPASPAQRVETQPRVNNERLRKAIDKYKAAKQAKTARKHTCSDELQCLSDTIEKYNSRVEYKDEQGNTHYYAISREEIRVWVTYQVNQGLYDLEVIRNNDWGKYYVEHPDWKSWFDQDLVGYDGRQFIPEALFYSGNIYRWIERLQKSKEQIVATIGEAGYQKQLNRMEASKPEPLIITADEKRKLHLLPFDRIWNEIDITQLADGQDVNRYYSIGGIFYYNYLQNLSSEELTFEKKRTTAHDIYNYWVEKNNFPRETYSAQEKAAIKRNTNIIGSRLFDRFLVEMLTSEDKAKIAARWNALRNNYKPIEYYKIPVGFEVSRLFKGGNLHVRPAQREGVAFMNSRGTGIIAYDVGVGKTMTAILGISDGFAKGLFKRPLVVVPQKVYRKWIGEISGVFAEKDIYEQKTDPKTGKKKRGKKRFKKGDLIAEGILPQIKVNDYDNLGTNYISRAMDKNGVAHTVDAYSITMVTFEGLVKIGFGEGTETALITRLKEALSQGESGRGRAILEQRAEDWIDKALEKTEIDIEEMGIDAIIVDEGHNFKNLFMDVKGDVQENGKREAKHFLSGSSSQPSSRALSLFMLNAYVQDKHQRRNTFALTATPFTNRATEIYSMLALYDYEGLHDFDVYNIAQFCTTFIDETLEDVWTAAGKFDTKAVIRGYNNLPILQSMIFRSIIYKTGEDANIQRPEKVILPLKTDEKGVPLHFKYVVDTTIKPSAEQRKWFREAADFANNAEPNKRDATYLATIYPPNFKGVIGGQTLVSLNVARTVTFSPYALTIKDIPQYDISTMTAEKFVDGSPKIRYVVECIKTVRDYHARQGTPMSGQVIYSDRGTKYFQFIREYLIGQLGFGEQEVAIFHGKVGKGKREKIKDGFLSGDVKVIIGSSTMREGVDLQKYGTVLYVCYLDWNPTDLHQLMGRIWRFGNTFSHVRIVVPLIENSSDVFTWQKLSEKMSRLNSIWTRANGTKIFEESDLDPEDLKKGLINDPTAIARFEIAEEEEALKTELTIANGAIDQLEKAAGMKEEFINLVGEIDAYVREAKEDPKLDYRATPDQRHRLKNWEITDDKSKLRLIKAYSRLYRHSNYSMRTAVEKYIKYAGRINRLEKNILVRYKLTVFDDFSAVTEEYRRRAGELTTQLEVLRSPEHFEEVLERAVAEKELEQKNSRTITQRVEEFQRLNYLLDCKTGIHTCDIYGRVEEAKSGKVLEVVAQEKPVIVDDVTEQDQPYRMNAKLKKLMPPAQRSVVREILGDEGNKGYVKTVLLPLEEQVATIPQLRKTESVPLEEKIIYAHFFLAGSDWYIAEWDGKRELFGYAVLNNDHVMAEWGYIPLSELHGINAELDFHWQPKPFAQVVGEDARSPILPPPVEVQENALPEAIEALRTALEFAEGDARRSLNEAVEALEIALEFA